MTNKQTTPMPEMTMYAGEGMNIAAVASILATCYDRGGFVHAILFTGNKIEQTLDPKVSRAFGVYSAIWMLPKEEEPGDNGKNLKLADAGKE